MPLSAVPLTACEGPLSSLDPAGPAAAQIAGLAWGLFFMALVVSLLMLVLFAMGFGSRQRHLSARTWALFLGVGFPLTVLTGFVGWGLVVGESQTVRDASALQVSAEGRRWEWHFKQPGPDGKEIGTTGTLYIPAGEPVIVNVSSVDVIHSFWVPTLAGKVDAIPGRVNQLKIEAYLPGTYPGICAEFCGLNHTSMRFAVVAYAPGHFPALPGSELK